MSLVTTVVVFVASMVLGECRQMSSTSQTGNGSFQLQVTLANLVSILQPEQCVHLEPCCSCLQLGVLCPFPERMSTLACILPALSKAQAVDMGSIAHWPTAHLSPGPFSLSLFRPLGHTDFCGVRVPCWAALIGMFSCFQVATERSQSLPELVWEGSRL